RKLAVAAGARFRSADVVSLRRHDKGWLCELDDGCRILAPWIVEATGRNARVLRLLRTARERGPSLVALYAPTAPPLNHDLDRTLIEARPQGWFYAGRLDGRRWAIGLHTLPGEAARIRRSPPLLEEMALQAPVLTKLLGRLQFDDGIVARDA